MFVAYTEAEQNAATDTILQRLAQGTSLRRICEEDESLPDRGTFLRWLNDDPALAAKYARARDIQAEVQADEMAVIEEDLRNGAIDAAIARVILDSKRWRAAKLAPKKYGDKLDLSHSGEVGVRRIVREILPAPKED